MEEGHREHVEAGPNLLSSSQLGLGRCLLLALQGHSRVLLEWGVSPPSLYDEEQAGVEPKPTWLSSHFTVHVGKDPNPHRLLESPGSSERDSCCIF